MISHIELNADCAREHRRDLLATAEHDRIVDACTGGLPLTRRMARPLGHALFHVSAWLLRYGKAEHPARLYRPSVSSIELN